MKLSDFDFRIWDNEDKLYLEQKYTKKLNCFEAVGYAVGLVGNGQIKSVYEIITGLDSTQDGLDDYEWINNLGEDKWEIELFTGLYDKNGKKVYEGDILRSGETFDDDEIEAFIDYVKFENGSFHMISCFDGEEAMLHDCDLSDMVIIGNIHENENLLKG